MEPMGIILAAGIIGCTGLLIGLLLGIAGKKFAVEVDEKEAGVREELPGNNCGGCGFAGCDALAKAIANGEAPVNACPVGGAPVAEKIGAIMGVSAEAGEKKVAFVKCSGTCDKTERKANYFGVEDCRKAAVIPGKSDKKCSYGCMGLGSCVKSCDFDAVHIVDGVAVVDRDKCVACGKCIKACPNGLIEFVPYGASTADSADGKSKVVAVVCSSKDKGVAVKAACDVGCIGCGICAKQCEFGAVSVEGNLAYIDQSKCTGCGKCAEKCPQKVIRVM